MWPNLQFPVTFTEEILHGKLLFCAVVDVRLGSKYTSDSIQPSWLFLCENKTLATAVIRCRSYNMKNKIKWLLPFSINSRPLAPAFHTLLTTSCSLYPFICLLYSTGYCFTFSHNRPAKSTLKKREGGGGTKWRKKGTSK